jgi:hypothetical protein
MREHLHARQNETLKLDEGLLEEGDIVEIFSPNSTHAKAKIDCALRELVIVLLPCKSFLLGGSDESTVA